jgi:RNA polymerase sigma factor FliA
VLLEDLVHAGTLGLLEAVNKFNPHKNVHLRHYAAFRIRGVILDSLRESDWGTRELRRKRRRIERAILDCKVRFGCNATESEIAAEPDVTLKRLQHFLGDLNALDLLSVQSFAGNDSLSDDMLADRVAEENDPFCQTLRAEMVVLMVKAMREMFRRERQVLLCITTKNLP